MPDVARPGDPVIVERGVPLRRHEVPFDLPTADVELRWHRRVNNDPASQWLRDRLRAAIHPLTAIRSE